MNKEDSGAWYNLACVESLTGHTDKAIACLKKAFDCGYADFRNLERDTDLDAIRQLPQFKEFLAHKGQIQRASAAKIAKELRRSLGSDYLIEVDDENRLIFAANLDRQTLDEVKQKLTAQAKALWTDLFDNHFEQYETIVVASEKDADGMMGPSGGGYDSGSHRLVARQIGYSLVHEFTHVLHHADQDARGQIHPVWIAEGLATFSETSNRRTGVILGARCEMLALPGSRKPYGRTRSSRYGKFVSFDHNQYMQQPSICYSEGRYLMMYLYSKGVLRKWYDAYVAGFKDDSTGGRAMEAVLGKNLDEIEKDFVAYAEALAPVAIRPIKGGSLGVNTLGPSDTSAAPDGLKIRSVVPRSGAFDAGLKPGDIITHVDGQRMVYETACLSMSPGWRSAQRFR